MEVLQSWDSGTGTSHVGCEDRQGLEEGGVSLSSSAPFPQMTLPLWALIPHLLSKKLDWVALNPQILPVT